MAKGKLVVIEGPDGCGKTTQVRDLVAILKDKGYPVTTYREPGSTHVGQKIREILLHDTMDPVTELLLFQAARIELVKTKIIPDLEKGIYVVLDRFTDSTYVYQGLARGLSSLVDSMEDMTKSYVTVDQIAYLDVSAAEARKRLQSREGALDRFDSEKEEFRKIIFEGYKKRYLQVKDKAVVINGTGPVAAVTLRLLKWFEEKVAHKETPVF